jgi:hypothetical protein
LRSTSIITVVQTKVLEIEATWKRIAAGSTGAP